MQEARLRLLLEQGRYTAAVQVMTTALDVRIGQPVPGPAT